jgi:hypothetical protein
MRTFLIIVAVLTGVVVGAMYFGQGNIPAIDSLTKGVENVQEGINKTIAPAEQKTAAPVKEEPKKEAPKTAETNQTADDSSAHKEAKHAAVKPHPVENKDLNSKELEGILVLLNEAQDRLMKKER